MDKPVCNVCGSKKRWAQDLRLKAQGYWSCYSCETKRAGSRRTAISKPPKPVDTACSVCGYRLKVYWQKNPRHVDGGRWHTRCYRCEANGVTERSPSHYRGYRLKYRYNITVEQQEEMLSQQKGKCAICECSITLENCHTDHDHLAKTVRDLLCANCNVGIGRFGESPDMLMKAINYLKRWGK